MSRPEITLDRSLAVLTWTKATRCKHSISYSAVKLSPIYPESLRYGSRTRWKGKNSCNIQALLSHIPSRHARNDNDLLLCRYEHKIMGTERPQASEIRGGIIADEMGLGKTMVMLATIVGSLGRAANFVSKASEKHEFASFRKRSKATLVIVPSSSESPFLAHDL